jgi:hypothetical protein
LSHGDGGQVFLEGEMDEAELASTPFYRQSEKDS